VSAYLFFPSVVIYQAPFSFFLLPPWRLKKVESRLVRAVVIFSFFPFPPPRPILRERPPLGVSFLFTCYRQPPIPTFFLLFRVSRDDFLPPFPSTEDNFPFFFPKPSPPPLRGNMQRSTPFFPFVSFLFSLFLIIKVSLFPVRLYPVSTHRMEALPLVSFPACASGYSPFWAFFPFFLV